MVLDLNKITAALLLLVAMQFSGTRAAYAAPEPVVPQYAYPGGVADGFNERDSRVACSDDGRCLGVSVAGPPSGPFGGPTAIFVAHSLDHGLNWAAPVQASEVGTTRNFNPEVVWAGGSTWVLVWSKLEGNTSFGEPELYYARSTDDGLTWSIPAYLNNDGGSTDEWLESSGAIASDHAGKVVAVWSAYRQDEPIIRRAVSLDAGATWSDPVTVPSDVASIEEGDYTPNLRRDAAGSWLIVWVGRRAIPSGGTRYQLLYSRSLDNAATWSTSAYLVPESSMYGSSPGEAPAIGCDDSGGWMVSWPSNPIESAGTDTEIQVSHSPDNGVTWGAPVTVNHLANVDGAQYNGGTDTDPDIEYDGNGRWVLAWSSDMDIDGVAGTDADVALSISQDDGATWTDTTPLNATAVEDGSAADFGVSLTRVTSEEFLATWTSSYDFENPTDSESSIVYGRLLTGEAPEGIYDFSVQPVLADPGDRVRIAFKVGAQLQGYPSVTVNGEPAQLSSASKSLTYEFEYVIPEWTLLGDALIQVNVTEVGGDPLVYTNSELHIVAALGAASTTMLFVLMLCFATLFAWFLQRYQRVEFSRR